MLRSFDGTQTNVVYDANLDTAAIGSYSEQMRRVVSLERTNGAVTSDVADVVYNFEYDELGRKTAVKVGDQALLTNVYSSDRKSRLDEVQYGNGGKVKYTYDDFDRVTGVGYDNDESPRFSYEYDSKGRAAFVKDSNDGSTIRTDYDQTDRPNEAEQRDGEGNLKYRTLIEYDKKNRIKAFNEATDDANFKTEYTYDADNRVTKVRYNSSDTSKVDYVYDKLNRITSRTVTNGTSAYMTRYAYASGAAAYGENATTLLVSSITQGEDENAMNFAYTYDNRGNITSETRNGLTTTYVYDALGQLVRVNDPHENATWVYAYDRGGNILNKAKYAYTTEDELGEIIESIPYTYGDGNWKDKLTAYNGVPITYDANGNLLDDGTWMYKWQAGRQLKSMTNAVTGVTMEFTYNHEGLRTKKVKKVNGVPAETTEYLLNGKNVVGLTFTDHVSNKVDRLHFFYDEQGKVIQTKLNDTAYSYVYNHQGDVVGILDNSGCLVVEYKYDAWGGLCTTVGTMALTLGKLNAFRYRNYIYDEETKLYYLQSRYYSPGVCRFAAADDQINYDSSLIGSNLFAYCNNNPVMHEDSDGHMAVNPIGILIGGLVGAAAGVLLADLLGLSGWKRWLFIAGCTAAGALLGNFLAPYMEKLAALAEAKVAASSTVIASSWQEAEELLRKARHSVQSVASRTLQTPLGKRICDAYNVSRGLVGEAKYGYQGLSRFIKSEIEKDAFLISEGFKVEWHFYISQITGKGGPSGPLERALIQAGIKIVKHF